MNSAQGFYLTTVLGSTGTGGVFIAVQQARREFAGETLKGPAVWSDAHEALLRQNDKALSDARALTDENSRVRYGQLKALFETSNDTFIQRCYAIWHQDVGNSLVRHSGTLLATEMHARGLLSDGHLIRFYKFFLTSARGRELHAAQHEAPMFEHAADAS